MKKNNDNTNYTIRLLPACLCLLASQQVQAKSQFPVCTVPQHFGVEQITDNPAKDAIYMEADQGLINRTGVSSLVGNIIIQQNDLSLNAQKASIDGTNNRVVAKGKIVLSTKNVKLDSDAINYQLDSQTGELNNVRYQLKKSTTNGRSDKIIQTNGTQLELQGATYTTCPPSANGWHIAADNIKLDQDKQQGTAKNVTFKVGNTPIFYFPWLSFSLNNQRKSGFLSPSFQISEQSGWSVATPYYFNLAPEYDATLTPSYLSKRGLKIDGEFRYSSKQHQGIWEYEILPRDKASDGNQRDYFKINHSSKLSDSIRLNVKSEGVSDKKYFDDFGKSLSSSSTSALERRIEVVKVGKNWHFSAASIDYQTLDATDSSYSKLPELKFNYTPKLFPNDIKLTLDVELSNFDKDNAPTGQRFDLSLNVSKKFGDDAWYFKPSVGLRHTYYNLKNNPTGNTHSRSLPTLSLDAGLFFDRPFDDGKLTQTLEPRLFYTYTPFRDQHRLPVFDTAKTDFSTSTQLFSENRYTGKDRIGDTNNLTFALSSRIQDRKTGRELLHASVGQILYFEDRKVTLPDETIQTHAQSEFAFELSTNINEYTRLSTSTFWEPKTQQWTATETQLNYKDDKNRIANLSYRTLSDELEQASLSFATPLDKSWSIVGRIDHDLKNGRNLETLAGVEYQNCCWKARFVGRKYLTSDNNTYDDAVFLQFELKGLGNLGNKASNFLEDKIYGYEK
ncbi:MAG: LPS assembly protein LptD [Cocleimonas sp.]|nr:LPS assembly protein LptD [Cocleimonas sp.]